MCDPNYKARTWGFRFSLADAIAICVFLAAAAGLRHLGSALWWLLVIAAGHFFLFCNVFRIARRRELFWAALFVLNVGAWTWFGRLIWTGVLFWQLPFTAGVIIDEMRRSGYHGAFADKINPRLNEYLRAREVVRG